MGLERQVRLEERLLYDSCASDVYLSENHDEIRSADDNGNDVIAIFQALTLFFQSSLQCWQ
jgi:hypothetical protein